MYVFGLLSFFPSPVISACASWQTGTAGVSPPSPLWGMMEPSSSPQPEVWRTPPRCQTADGATVRPPGAGCHTSRPRALLGGGGAAVCGALHGAYVCTCGGGFPLAVPAWGFCALFQGVLFATSFDIPVYCTVVAVALSSRATFSPSRAPLPQGGTGRGQRHGVGVGTTETGVGGWLDKPFVGRPVPDSCGWVRSGGGALQALVLLIASLRPAARPRGGCGWLSAAAHPAAAVSSPLPPLCRVGAAS